MRWLRPVLWTVFTLLVLAAAIIGVTGYLTLMRPVKLAKPQTVIVLKDASFRYVANRLQARKIIPSARALRIYARLTHKAGKMQVGEYEVKSGMRPIDILQMFVEGRVKMYWLTIPEGKWATEIGTLLAADWPGNIEQFRTLIAEPSNWKGKVPFPLPSGTLEGYLFPDTYRLPRGITADQIIGKMLERFQITCWKAYQQHDPGDTRSLHDVLVLASLVEGEAKVPGERKIIAGVYMNRLRKGIKLQCDATVLYAHHKRLTRVLFRDLDIDSPYNTYKYPGLPPGPINNPGLKSFEAALHPANVPYYYYVAKGDGSHVFSTTLAEHNAAIARIRGTTR